MTGLQLACAAILAGGLIGGVWALIWEWRDRRFEQARDNEPGGDAS